MPGKVLVIKGRDIYHHPDCRFVKNKSLGSLIEYRSTLKAENDGKSRCKQCKDMISTIGGAGPNKLWRWATINWTGFRAVMDLVVYGIALITFFILDLPAILAKSEPADEYIETTLEDLSLIESQFDRTLLYVVTSTSTVTRKSAVSETITPSRTFTATVTPLPLSFPEDVSVGIIYIDNYKYEDILFRIHALGISAEWIEASSNFYNLDDYDVIYLPTGWGFEWGIIGVNRAAYLEYVREGGGLLIEQPNYGSDFSPDNLPYEVLFENHVYNPDDWPPVITVPDHFLTHGLDRDEVPGPQNYITILGNEFQVLVQTRNGDYPTLAISEYGEGRIIVSSGSASPSGGSTTSDELLNRYFLWLSRIED